MTGAIVRQKTGPFVSVSLEEIDDLKQTARTAEKRRARICLHPANEHTLHEMLIVLHRETLIAPHRHLTKCESFLVLEGLLTILLFDEIGAVAHRVQLGGPSEGTRPFMYRLNEPLWHSVIPETEFAVFHEVTQGPFVDGEWDHPSWCPDTPDRLRTFLDAAMRPN